MGVNCKEALKNKEIEGRSTVCFRYSTLIVLIQCQSTQTSDCGTVPEYTAPNLDFATEPEPLMKEVSCKENIIGNWVVIQQTRENEVLMLSEIKFLNGK